MTVLLNKKFSLKDICRTKEIKLFKEPSLNKTKPCSDNNASVVNGLVKNIISASVCWAAASVVVNAPITWMVVNRQLDEGVIKKGSNLIDIFNNTLALFGMPMAGVFIGLVGGSALALPIIIGTEIIQHVKINNAARQKAKEAKSSIQGII